MIFFDNRTDFEIGGNILTLLESIACSVTNRDIEFLLVSDDEICALNAEFLGKDYHMSTQGGKPNVRVSYLLTAWPDYADDGQYVTTIEITDPAVFVYGLTVESEPTEFERVMMSMGYKVELADNSIQRAVRDGFTFSICRGDTPKLVISAEVSNREEICF